MVLRWAFCRGGKTPHTFDNDKRIAAHDDRNVMMPSGERAPLEMVKAKFLLHFLVHDFGSPAFLDDSNHVFFAHSFGQVREHEFRWFGFSVEPFHDEPKRLLILGLAFSLHWFYPAKAKS